MLVVRSQMTAGSSAYDRIAVLMPEQIPHVAKARGWDHVVLADERTMAGALRFLASAKAIGIRASAGMQASRLSWRGGEMAMMLVPLDQAGLERLVRTADLIANATRAESVLTILQEADRAAAPGAKPDVVAFLMPRPDTDLTDPTRLKDFVDQVKAARLGPVVALAEGGAGAEPVQYAPQQAALDLAREAGLPIARVTLAYSKEAPDKAFGDALLAMAADSPGSSSLSARERQPVAFPDPSVPPGPEARDDAASRLGAQVAGRLDRMSLSRKPTLPARLGLAEGEDADETLRLLAREGFRARLERNQVTDEAESRRRLEAELEIMTGLGFSNYFLILEKAITFARGRNIPIGYGRGSAAGSMVVYSLGITNIDPVKHKLIFERFINPERVSLPDIDTDICMNRRHEVLQYLADTFGHERFAHIATYGSKKTRGAIQAAARVLSNQGAAARLNEAIEVEAKRGPAMEPDEQLRHQAATNPDEGLRRLADLAARLLGVAGDAGVHAGGVVMADTPIREWAPLSAEKSDRGLNVVSTNMEDTEKSGLVKYDLLGLTTLTMMRHATDSLAEDGIEVDLDAISYEDAAVYEMIRRGRTKTVFQVESPGMAQAAREVGVNKLDDLVALVALYRPGPMDNIPLYAARKAGRAPVEYLDPSLEPILEDTYGIIIYQEQIIQMARSYAGYTMGEADVLRKAVGKKNAADVEAARGPFLEKSAMMGRDEETSRELFDFILPFARYGFNRAHAASYGTVCYQTAWLKHHHPAHWLSACATYSKGSQAIVASEAARSGILVLPPSVNDSRIGFHAVRHEGKWAIRVPVEAILKMNSGHVARMIQERDANGRFKSMRDLASRCPWFTEGQFRDLVDAGACDCLGRWPAGILRAHFAAIAADRKLRVAVASAAGPQADFLGAMANNVDVRDPEPVLARPGCKDGVVPHAPEEVVARQDALLPGMFRHEKRQIRSTGWIKQVETLIDLKKAARIGTKMEARTIVQLIKISDRETVKGDAGRVLMLTIEDETGQQTYDVSAGCRVETNLAECVNRTMIMTLGPASGEAFITQRPQIVALRRYEDPLTATPQPYPIVHVDREVDQAMKVQIMDALRKAPKPPRKDGQAQSNGSEFMLLVSPAREIEPMRLEGPARLAGLAATLGGLECVTEVWE